MRIWSVHPEYLDTKGLVALWRESLLAKHVLEGKTKGYKNHPQLNRFRTADNPLNAINQYLSIVYLESIKRGFSFDKSKISLNLKPVQLTVTKGQMEFEKQHLLKKLENRDIIKYSELKRIRNLNPHPLFKIIEGEIEKWEIIEEIH